MPRYPYGVRPSWESGPSRGRSTSRFGLLNFGVSSGEKTMGEKYVEAIEEEGDVEEVTKKFLNKIKRQPGATKESAVEYLARAYRRAQEEGRI